MPKQEQIDNLISELLIIKSDLLKIIDKLETLEQWIINLDYVIKDSKNRIKELELKGAK